jgi:hypothetical protein
VTDAQMVGVTWDGDRAAEFVVEVQDKQGQWSAVPEVDAETSAEPGSKDAARQATLPDNGSAPVWLGDDAQAVRVVVESGQATNLEVATVDADSAAAPSGSANAAGLLPIVDGPGRYLFAGALFGVAALLAAIALGWSPWKRRRSRAVVAGVALSLLVAACAPSPAPAPDSSIPNGSVKPSMTYRSQWGARPFACGTPDYAHALKFAVVHHTVNGNSYTSAESPGMIRGIQAYHMDALGYCDIAYNFLIDRYGQIFVGRDGGVDKPVIAGHAGGFNTASTGIAILGDHSSVGVTQSTWNRLIHLLRWRLSVAGIDPSKGDYYQVKSSPCNCQRWAPGTWVYFSNLIMTHRDVNYTACPGDGLYPKLGQLRSQVQQGIVLPPTTTTTTTVAP